MNARIAYVAAYVLVGIGLAIALDILVAGKASAVAALLAGWLSSSATAYLAIRFALRFGPLRHRDLFAASLFIAIAWLLFIAVILHAIGNQGDVSTSWLRTFAALDWMPISNGFAQMLLPPIALLALVRKHAARGSSRSMRAGWIKPQAADRRRAH